MHAHAYVESRSQRHEPRGRAAWAAIALLACLLVAHGAHAQVEASCTEENWTCDCEPNWGCWELFFTARGAYLGMKATTAFVSRLRAADALTASLMPTYSTEHYGTRRTLSAHVAIDAAVGGGTHGTEGSLFGSFSVGARASLDETRGFFARGGAAVTMLGNDVFTFRKLEPLQLRLGYQILDAPMLIEVGTTQGFVLVGDYALGERRGSLSRAPELGAYAALRFSRLRLGASLEHVATNVVRDAASAQLARANACMYFEAPWHVVACVELVGVHTGPRRGEDYAPVPIVRYVGLGVGLSP